MKKELTTQNTFNLYYHSILVKSIKKQIEKGSRDRDDFEIDAKQLNWMLFQWKVPDILKPCVVKELEIQGLVTRKNKQIYIINESKLDLDNVGWLYEKLGLWGKEE